MGPADVGIDFFQFMNPRMLVKHTRGVCNSCGLDQDTYEDIIEQGVLDIRLDRIPPPDESIQSLIPRLFLNDPYEAPCGNCGETITRTETSALITDDLIKAVVVHLNRRIPSDNYGPAQYVDRQIEASHEITLQGSRDPGEMVGFSLVACIEHRDFFNTGGKYTKCVCNQVCRNHRGHWG